MEKELQHNLIYFIIGVVVPTIVFLLLQTSPEINGIANTTTGMACYDSNAPYFKQVRYATEESCHILVDEKPEHFCGCYQNNKYTCDSLT